MVSRIKEFKISSVVRNVPRELLENFEPRRKKPERGDVLVCAVSKVGWHDELENRFGRSRRLFEGDRVVVAIGNRYATGEFEGKIPEKVRYGIDLLNAGGVCGKMVGKNVLVPDPTRLTFIGYVVHDGEVINLRQFAIKEKELKRDVPIILVVGSGMDAGKTTTAASIIKSLVTKGEKICGGKLTGTARSKDILHMRDAGASFVLDHVDAGFPSTYKCKNDQILEIFECIYSNLAWEEPDYIVFELADGIFQRETDTLLKERRFMDRVAGIFFSASDSLSAYGGYLHLKKMGLNINAFSGPVANSKLTIREVFENTGIHCISPLGTGMEIIRSLTEGRK